MKKPVDNKDAEPWKTQFEREAKGQPAIPPSIPTPQAEETQSSRGRKKNKNKEPDLTFSTRLTEKVREQLRALAWYDRVTERHIVETALSAHFEANAERVEKAMNLVPKKTNKTDN